MRLLFSILFLMSPLLGAPHESLFLQEMRLELQELAQKNHAYKVDIDLLHEKIENLHAALSNLKEEAKNQEGSDSAIAKEMGSQVEKRVAAVEKIQKNFSADLKLLKELLNSSTMELGECSRKVQNIEKELSNDIRSLKSTLQTIVTCLEGEKNPGKVYLIQGGDTLEKIAQKHGVSVKALKSLNNLTSENKIIAGQKLQIP